MNLLIASKVDQGDEFFMEGMDKKFGSIEFLSVQVARKVESIIDYLVESGEYYNIYYGYPIIDENDEKEYVKGIIITKKKIIILYEHEDEISSYGSSLISHLSADKTLFKITMNYTKYVEQFDVMSSDFKKMKDIFQSEEVVFDGEDIKKINRSLQVAFNLTSEDDRQVTSMSTMGAKIKERNTYIGNYDSTQFNMVHSPLNSHQRIRGLAGSGKTILMLKKLAFLHYNYPDLKMAFVFYTTSLKQDVEKKFKDFYKDYDRYGTPDMSKVSIFHSWGGGRRRGFYSDLCERYDKNPLTYADAKTQATYVDPFEYVCSDLIEYIHQEKKSGIYDFVFVDEAQDFGINFFKLCLSVLKEADLEHTKLSTGYLVYAYDELQSLREETKIPSKNEIFGSSQLCKDINLKKCYRTPVEILTSAHAIGLGVYRNVDPMIEHPLVNLADEKTLIDTGYTNLSGQFEEGKEVILKREEEKKGVEIEMPQSFQLEAEEYAAAATKMLDLIQFEDIMPKDIMIIDLDERYVGQDHAHFSKIFREELQKRNMKDHDIRINLVDKNNPVRVKIENAIPYTTIYRAKGNEANLVFILNCNSISLSFRNSTARNKIFTAMTRAKWQVWLYGKDMEDYSHELTQVKTNDYMLKFNYPTEEQRKAIKILGDKEVKFENKLNSATEILNNLPDDLIEQLLRQRLGKKNLKNE